MFLSSNPIKSYPVLSNPIQPHPTLSNPTLPSNPGPSIHLPTRPCTLAIARPYIKVCCTIFTEKKEVNLFCGPSQEFLWNLKTPDTYSVPHTNRTSQRASRWQRRQRTIRRRCRRRPINKRRHTPPVREYFLTRFCLQPLEMWTYDRRGLRSRIPIQCST